MKNVKALPVVIKQGQSVYEAVVSLILEDINTLFVVDDDGALLGVLTGKDLLKAAIGKTDLHGMPVEMVMTRFPQVIWVDESTPVLEALEKLNQHQISCLPVVKGGHRPSGRFDMGIVLKLLDEMVQGHFEEGEEY